MIPMDKPDKNNKIQGRLTSAILCLFIIYGFISTSIQTMYMSLNSDSVTFGIASMEIWKHGNYFLSGFYLSAADPFIFSDILPFYLIPQVLSGYDPTVLKLTGMAVFTAAVLIFAYIIYRTTGSSFSGLAFAALAMNVQSYPFFFFQSPAWHNASLLITGVILLLLFNQHSLDTDPRSMAKLLISVLVINLMVFSDSIVIAVLVIPLLACYILYYKNKSLVSHLLVGLSAASLLVTYYIKTKLITNLVSSPLQIITSPGHLLSSAILYCNGILALLEMRLYYTASGSTPISPTDVLLIACSIILLSYAAWRIVYRRDPRLMPLYSFLLVASLVIFAAYIITDYGQNIGTSRYLVFTGFAILIAVSTAMDNKNTIFVAVLLIILLVSAYTNTAQILSLKGHQPNANELKLIDFLKANGQSYGYGDYWDSNVITYLSHEDVRIRPAFFDKNGLHPILWLSDKNWYNNDQSPFFIIVQNGNAEQKAQMAELASAQPPEKTLSYGHYMIYVYHRPISIS